MWSTVLLRGRWLDALVLVFLVAIPAASETASFIIINSGESCPSNIVVWASVFDSAA